MELDTVNFVLVGRAVRAKSNWSRPIRFSAQQPIESEERLRINDGGVESHTPVRSKDLRTAIEVTFILQAGRARLHLCFACEPSASESGFNSQLVHIAKIAMKGGETTLSRTWESMTGNGRKF